MGMNEGKFACRINDAENVYIQYHYLLPVLLKSKY